MLESVRLQAGMDEHRAAISTPLHLEPYIYRALVAGAYVLAGVSALGINQRLLRIK